MPTLDDVATIALALPGSTEADSRGTRTWRVHTKMFVWERPFTKADLRRFGDQPVPSGELVAVRCADLHDKEAVLASGQVGVFTMAHFDGYAAVLIALEETTREVLTTLVEDSWACCATAAQRALRA